MDVNWNPKTNTNHRATVLQQNRSDGQTAARGGAAAAFLFDFIWKGGKNPILFSLICFLELNTMISNPVVVDVRNKCKFLKLKFKMPLFQTWTSTLRSSVSVMSSNTNW